LRSVFNLFYLKLFIFFVSFFSRCAFEKIYLKLFFFWRNFQFRNFISRNDRFVAVVIVIAIFGVFVHKFCARRRFYFLLFRFSSLISVPRAFFVNRDSESEIAANFGTSWDQLGRIDGTKKDKLGKAFAKLG
jgi:hypothetical protein